MVISITPLAPREPKSAVVEASFKVVMDSTSEVSAQEKLYNTLQEINLEIEIVAILSSVKESVNFLKGFPKLDLIFCDVQMPDGLSFEIFEKTQVKIPVIFITGYGHYMLTAFESNGIDYVIKPVAAEDMTKALLKYKILENHFVYLRFIHFMRLVISIQQP